MDHVVYTDAKAGEMEKLLDGIKRMVIRGATGRKLPYGRAEVGDRLFFIRNSGEGLVRASAVVTTVFNSPILSQEESCEMVQQHQEQLQLSPAETKRWSGKRYLVLVSVGEVAPVEPFAIDKSEFGNMDDWLPVGVIDRVRRLPVG